MPLKGGSTTGPSLGNTSPNSFESSLTGGGKVLVSEGGLEVVQIGIFLFY